MRKLITIMMLLGISTATVQACVPSIPDRIEHSECKTQSSSGKYVTVDIFRNSTSSCFDLSIYGGNGSAHGNTCGGLSGGWSVMANGESGYANDVSSAIQWMLNRI